MLASIAGAVLGGFRSVPLAALGGLLLGAVQSLVAGYASFAADITGFSDAVPFIVLLIGLAVFGRERARRAGAATESPYAASFAALPTMPGWRRLAPWIFWFGALLLWLFVGADRYWIGLTTQGLALALVFLSFVIVTGIGGIVSLAQAAFVTASGLMAGVLIDHYHQTYAVGLIGGIVFAVVLGVVIALPALRLGGLALALATLALGFIGDSVLFQWSWLGGTDQAGWAIPRPSIGPLHLSDNRSLAVTLLVVVVLVTLMIHGLQRSSSGRMMEAVKAAEPAAVTGGISAIRGKLSIFAVSAALAGLGGVLLVTYDQHVTNTTYTTPVGLVWLATVVLWGIRRPSGAIAAAVTGTLFTGFLASGFHFSFISWTGTTSPYVPSVLFGLGAVVMAQNPDGLLSLHEQSMRRLRRRTEQRRSPQEVSQRGAVPALGGAGSIGRAGAPAVDGATPPGSVEERVSAEERGLVGTPFSASGRPGGQIRTPNEPDHDAALVVQDLDACYGDTQALFGIDLTVPKGSLTALVGANGAGKSTLCGVLSGLLVPTKGSIWLGAEDITDLPPHRRSPRLLLAPESRGVFPELSVEENLSLLLPDADLRSEVFKRFPALANRRQLQAGSLSGGEQQMLTMAPLMVRPPELLVADEPTLGLAPLVARNIVGMLQRLREQGTSLLVVEERARAILEVADRVVLLELGKVVWSGPRAELDADRLAAIYLGSATV